MGLQGLIGLLARHAASYVELGAAAAAEWRSAWRRRFVLLWLAMATGIAGAAALWGAGLLLLWNTPWRVVYAFVSAVLLLLVALWALRGAVGKASAGPSAGALKSELEKDRELFHQWKSTL
jgi:MFS family permease